MRSVLCVAVLTLAIAAPALADDKCPPLTSVASIDLTPTGYAELVPVEIAGVRKLMVLDTGSSATVISEKAAKEIGLPLKASQIQLYGVSGKSTVTTTLGSFAIGMLKVEQFYFQIAPFEFSDEVAGALGADVLRKVDVSIDFGTHHMDLMTQDHCEGRVKHWKGEPTAVVPFTLAKNSAHIILEVEIDGRRMNAILDTGASTSTLTRPIAEGRLDVKIDTPNLAMPGEDGADALYHTFKTLNFEGVTVTNPQFVIIPDRASKHFENRELGSLLNRPPEYIEPPVLLGMNVLKHLHIYIAYREKKLYITPTAKPAAP
jgi:predicted aspartyl protease